MACYFGVGLDEYPSMGTGDMWIYDFPYCCGRRKSQPPWLLLPVVCTKHFSKERGSDKAGGEFILGNRLVVRKYLQRGLAVEESIHSIILTALSSKVQVE
jgi:hypothetical protein